MQARDVEGEETAEDGGNVLQPLRVAILCGQLSDPGKVAEDEEDVLHGEEWTLEHVLQSQGSCNVVLQKHTVGGV